MASKTVKSPAGETIELVPDDEWIDATGAEPNSLRQWNGSVKQWVFRALWEHGEFTSESGRAPAAMWVWLNEQFPGIELPAANRVMATFRNPINAAAVDFQVNGKRTFHIKLVALPEHWHGRLLQDIGNGHAQEAIAAAGYGDATDAIMDLVNGGNGAAPANVETVDEGFTDADWDALKLDAPTIYEEPPPLDFQIANQVAMSLLTTVVEIISSGKVDTTATQRLQGEVEAMQATLGERLEDLARLRKQLREAGDQIVALRHERDGLRTRLRQTEHNLNEALKGETAQAVNSEIQKRVDQIMRMPPASKGE